MSPKRYCSVVSCSEYANDDSQKCETHRHHRAQESAHRRGYGAPWRRIRKAFLENNPYCLSCGAAAEHVDHILSKSKGGTDDEHNLQPLCARCHGKKTATVDGASRNFRR